MANGGNINYNVRFNADTSGLNKATQEIQKIHDSLKAVRTINIRAAMAGKAPEEAARLKKELTEAQEAAKIVRTALQKSFNTKLNTINVTNFNNELKKSNINITEIGQKLSKAGVEGQAAFRNITAQIAKSKIEVKQTNKLLDEMKTTMLNSVKWGITSAIWNNMTGSIEKAWNFAKKLDSSLNDIRIVTDKSAGDMEKFAIQANKAAKSLGASTTGYTDASLIYYQQGLSDAEVQARTETTLKAANVTGQSAAEVSEQLTAVWNGYKVSAQEAELYVDKLSAVAATTAADLEELSTGMSKVASAANIMGVDIDQLNAQLATVVSVTRQAPESVGTAFKTIYARMGDIEAGLDTETSLGEYTKKMNEMGFNVLDTNGKLKDMGSVIEEIGNKWTDLSREQQVALSQTMAGTRQYNNLLALFDNWDEYTESLETSRNAAGSLQKQQDIYMESTEAHLQQLATEGERVYNSLFDSKQINPMIDGLTTLVSLIADAISGFGGMGPILLSLGSIFTRVFSKQIASSITTTVVNMRNAKKNAIELQEGITTLRKAGEGTTDEATKQISNMGQNVKDLALKGLVTQEQVDQLQTYIDKLADLAKAQGKVEQQQKDYQTGLNQASGKMEQSGIGKTSENRQTFSKIEEIAKKDNTDYSKIKEADELEAKLIANNKQYEELSKKLKKQRENLEDATKSAKQYAEALAEAADVNGASESERKDKNKALKKQAADLLEEINTGQFANVFRSRDDIQKAIQDYKESFDSRGRLTQASRKAAVNLATTYQSALEEMTNNINDIQDTAREAALGRSAQMSEELDSIINSEKKAVEEYQEEVNDIDFEKHISTITNLVGSIQSLASGIWGVINAFSVWGNEDLTFVEKLTQTISGLAIALPMAISGVTGFISGIKDIKTQLPELIIMIKTKAAVIDKAAAAERRETAANLAGAASETADTAANTGNVISEEVDANATDKAAAAERRETAANLAGAASETADTAANTGNASTKGLGKVIGKGLSKAGPALAVAAGIAVTVAAVAVAINIANAAYNKAQENAEKASKAAQELRDNYSQVKDETEALKASFDKYVETKKAIEELTVGTQEWKDAIREANIEVSDLISKYPELAKYISNVNGQLEISEEGRSTFLDKQKEAENEAYEASQAANIANLRAQSDLEIVKTVKDTESWNEVGWAATMGTGAASGATLGGIAGSAIPIPVLGNVIGAVVGGILGAGASALGSIWREANADVGSKEVGAVAEAYSKYGEQILDSAGSIKYFVEEATGIKLNDAQVELLANNTDALRKLCVAVDNNTTAQELQEQQVLSSAFEGNAIFDSSEVKDSIIKMLQDDVFEPTGEYYKAAEESVKKMSDDELMDAYAKKMNFNVDSSKKDNEGNYVFNLSDGTTRTIEQATVKSALIADEAIESAKKAIKTINDNLNEVYKGAQNFQGENGKSYNVGDTLLKFAGGEGSLMDATGEEIYGLAQYIEQLEKDDPEKLGEIAQKLGYESGEAFLKEYQRALVEQHTAEIDLRKKLYKQDSYYHGKGADNDYLNEMSLEQQQNTINLLNEAQRRLGNAGFEYFDELFAKNAQNAEEMSKLFAEVDWTSEESVSNLKSQLKALGITINDSDGNWNSFISSMKTSADMFNPVVNKLIELRNTLADIDKIAGNLEIGSIISDEDYQTLLKTNPELEKFFMLTNEGYKYIGTGKIGENLSDFIKNDLIIGEETLAETQKKAKDVAETIASWQDIPTNLDTNEQRIEFLKKQDQKTKDYLGIGGTDFDFSKLSETESLALLDQMKTAVNNYKTGLYDTKKVEELWISNNAKNLRQLNKLFLNGTISVQGYEKAQKALAKTEREAAGIKEEEFELYAKEIQELYNFTNAEAEAVAQRVLIGNEGISSLRDNWESYAQVFANMEPYTQSFIDSMTAVKTSLSQVLGGIEVSDDFVLNNQDKIKAAFVDGSKEALNQVKKLATEEYAEINIKSTVDESSLDDVNAFIKAAEESLSSLKFGDGMPKELSALFQKMLLSTKSFSAEMVTYLSGIGFSFGDINKIQQASKIMQKATDEHEGYRQLAYNATGLGFQGLGYELQYNHNTNAEEIGKRIWAALVSKTTSGIAYTDQNPKDTVDLDKGTTSSEPSKKDFLEEDRDRYHDINVEIKKLTNNLEDLKTAEEHLTGKDLINNLNQQLKILDKTVARQREKLKIQKQEQKELQAQLKSQGVQFDQDGTIANYNAALDIKMKAVNDAIAYYNSLSKEGQEAYEETLAAIEKDYEKFKEKIERYEVLVYDDMQNLEQEIADNISEQISLKIQAFDETIKIKLDFTDAKKSWIEFKKELDLAESDIFGRSEFDIKSISQLLEDIKTYQWSADTTIQDYKEGKAGSENSRFYVDGIFDEKAAMEALREEQENLQNALLAANQKINEVQRSYLNMLDQVQEKLDKQIAGYEHINELINHGLKLTELLSGEDSYKEKSTYYSKMATNYKDQIDMARRGKELWDAEIARAQQAIENATTDQEREIAQEQLDKVVENWRNATNELNDLVATAIENLQAQYENSIDQALQEMTEKFTNGKSLDYISKEWELINDNADRYLDTVNSTYEVQALEAKYMNAIDLTDNISAQKKLNKAMEEELAALREKDKLTQYDIDRANKKLDITMKQIALEEAQANKSTMRLRRDSQGNYSYQFVANEDEVANAQQDLLAAQNDLYNFDKEAYENNLDEAYQAYVQFQEDLKEAAMINDPEERAAREALIREQYEQKITDLTEINETIRSNLQSSAFESLFGMYNTNEENFKLMNDDIFADFSTLTIEDMPNLIGQLVEGWNTGIQQMITSFVGEDGLSVQCQTAYDAIKAAQDLYQESLEELETVSGKTFDNIESDIDKDIDKTNDLIKKNDELIDQIKNDLDQQWQLMAETLKKLREEYENLEAAAKAALDEMMRIQDYEHDQNTAINDDDSTNDNSTSNDNPNSPDFSSNSEKDNEEEENDSRKGEGEVPSADIMKGVAACIWYGTGAGGWENNPGRKAKLTEKFTKEGQQQIQGLLNNNKGALLSWAKQNGGANYNQWLADNYSYSKFDTGGFTGEWGSEGRMAMLHEKELVLNKEDTANILNAVSIVRGIGDMVSNLSANLLGNLSQRVIDPTLGLKDFEQTVHITADFPNVTSSSEIEDALRNLTNVAAQRAFSTRI